MITIKKLHSPFFVALLVLFQSCVDQPEKRQPPPSKYEPTINALVSAAEDTALSERDRLEKSNAAMRLVKKGDNPLLLGKVFYSGYNLRKSIVADSSLPFLRNYKNYALLYNDTLNLAFADYQLAEHYLAQGENARAFKYLNSSKTYYEKLHDSVKVAHKLLLMCNLHKMYNDYIEMQSAATESLRFLKPKDSIYLALAYNNLGVSFQNLSDYAEAIRSYDNAVKISKDPLTKIIVRNNIAVVHLESQNYQEAIKLLNTIKDNAIARADSLNYARILDNLGYAYYKMGQNEGIKHLTVAAGIRDRNNDDFGLIPSLIHLSEFYNAINPEKSVINARKAYAIATKLNSTDDRLYALAALIKASSGSESKALGEFYIRLDDSIGKVRQQAKNQFAKIKYDSKKEKEENQRLKISKAQDSLIIEKQRNRSQLLLFGIIGALGIGSFLIYYLLSKSKRRRQKAVYETEIRIAGRLHDELANDAYRTMILAQSMDLSDANSKETLITDLESIYNRTRNISKENETINTGSEFSIDLRELILSYNSESTNVLLTGIDTIDWENINSSKKIALYRILSELLVNMKKHSNAKVVVFNFEKSRKTVRVRYSDNGSQGKKERVYAKGGLQNAENRIHAIKGTFTFENNSGNGFKATITFPT